MMLCPMAALCPDGMGKRPYPGPRIFEQESWIPFADKSECYVHLVGVNSALDCMPYASMHPTAPDGD